MFLKQQLMVFCFWDQTREKVLPITPHGPLGIGYTVKQTDARVADVLTQGRQKLWENFEINVWVVFGHQILLDIHDILGSKASEGWRVLEQSMSHFRSTIDYKLQDGRLRFPAERLPSGGGGELAGQLAQRVEMARSGTSIGHQARKEAILKYVMVTGTGGVESTSSVTSDSLQTLRQSVQSNSEATARSFAVSPSREDNFLFAQNPIYCGFEAFSACSIF